MTAADPLDGIPAESLAQYVERIAAILEREGENLVEDLYPESGYGEIWAELAAFRKLDLEDVRRVESMAELLHRNRKKGGKTQ